MVKLKGSDKTPRSVVFVLWLLVCMYGVTAWGIRGRLPPLPRHVCPSEDPDTHECYGMTTQNTTCVVMTIGGCMPMDFILGRCEWHLSLDEVPCTVYTCAPEGCCEGWIEDDGGTCVADSENIRIQCLNGGWREGYNNKCNCPKTFTGQRCETPICDEPCLHGGRCEVVDGQRQCVCSSRFYTQPRCEQVICEEPCKNGGECIPDGVLSRCKCQPGYQGDHCQYEVSIHCPLVTPSLNSTACNSTENGCENSHCPANQICCYNGCNLECVESTNRTCRYRNVHYRAGETFSPESCEKCVCQPWGEVQCTRVECPTTECEDGHSPISVEGHCCKICPGTELSEEAGPEFKNCPERFVTIDVEEDGKTAILHVDSLGLTVTSHDGTDLGVTFSRTRFVHSKSSNIKKNMHIVTAYSDCDSSGRRAECHFLVIVRDPFPPVFSSCPMEIFALNDEEIDWADPVVKDNVGILKLQADGDEIRNSVLQVGTYSVSYTVWDYDQNQAICAFSVNVFNNDADPQTFPKEIKQRKANRNASLSAIVGSVFGLVLLITISVYLIVCLIKRRPVHRSHHEENSNPENHIYAVCGHGNHSYENFSKLPVYSPPTNPPPYDEVDHSFENPPIYEEISSHRNGEEHSYANIDTGHTNQSYLAESVDMKYMKL